MDLATALMEFSELLEIAARSLDSLLTNEAESGKAHEAVIEVMQIASRLGEISEQIGRA